MNTRFFLSYISSGDFKKEYLAVHVRCDRTRTQKKHKKTKTNSYPEFSNRSSNIGIVTLKKNECLSEK